MEKPIRKSPRLGTYDYSTSGGYFITICTNGKKHILSHITSSTTQPTVGVGVPDDPHSRTNLRVTIQPNVGAIHESPVCTNKLTEYGKIVDDVIKQLPERFGVRIDKYVIMPNHIHMIITISAETRAIRESPLRNKRSIVDQIVGYLKMNASKRMNKIRDNHNIWQRSYHDHIIRDEKDYLKIWGYIDTNVIRWTDDCFYSE